MKIIWTPNARIGYFQIIEFLETTWTITEIHNFILLVEKALGQIKDNPYMFEASRKKKNIRKGFITRHISLYYRIKQKKNEIELLAFWDNRQNPKELTY